MKKVFLMSFTALSLSLFSCHTDSVVDELQDEVNTENGNGSEPDTLAYSIREARGKVRDGGYLGSASLYCLEKGRDYLGTWYEYYAETKVLGNYSDMTLCMMLNGEAYSVNNSREGQEISELMTRLFWQQTSFLTEEYDKYCASHGKCGWPRLYSAYLGDEVSITCNKSLFGQPAGENLASHFRVVNNDLRCLVVGRENPSIACNFGEKQPEGMTDYFQKGSWLTDEYWLFLIDEPEERYDAITLTLRLPIVREHRRQFAASTYRGEKNPTLAVTEDTFTATCKIKFDWSQK